MSTDATFSGPHRMRTSDAEREQVATILRAAMSEGRLTLEEGEERLTAVYAAKFRDELGPLTADLPGGGPHFVDLDDCRSGPAVQDLWMLLPGERAEGQRALVSLLDGYEQMREFDRRELALIEPLRTLRLVHYSAWVARRWDDPAFPAAFPDFGTPDYWRGQVDTLVEQLEAMQAPPLVA